MQSRGNVSRRRGSGVQSKRPREISFQATSSSLEHRNELWARIESLLKSVPGSPIEAPRNASHKVQAKLLDQKLSQELARGRNFCRLGRGFALKPAQDFRDAQKRGVHLYADSSGTWTVVLEKDSTRPHQAIRGAFSDSCKLLFLPFNNGKLLIDIGKTEIEWNSQLQMGDAPETASAHSEKWAEKAPDIALVAVPVEDGHGVALLGEHSYNNETLDQLLTICQMHIELTKAEAVIGFNSATCQDEEELWKYPRVDAFVMSKHPQTSDLIFSGPIRIGAGSACSQAGNEHYRMDIKKALLIRRDEDAVSAADYVSLDFYEVITHAAEHLLIGKGVLSEEILQDRLWKARLQKMVDFADLHGFTRQQDLPREELDGLWMRINADI